MDGARRQAHQSAKKGQKLQEKKREKGRMKATGITQRHIVCLKQGLGRGSGTLVDLETTEKTKGTTCESTVVKMTMVMRKVMKVGEKIIVRQANGSM
jgi:hypothetical protein